MQNTNTMLFIQLTRFPRVTHLYFVHAPTVLLLRRPAWRTVRDYSDGYAQPDGSQPGGYVVPDSPVSNTRTSTKPPPRNPVPRNHADGPEPMPQKDGSQYWEQQDKAIPRNPPKPTDSKLAGQVETVELKLAPGVKLDGHLKQVVGSVLDLFQGKASKQRLAYWREDSVFEDYMNKAVGKKEVEGHWYGLLKVMNDIRMLGHKVIKVDPEENVVEVETQVKYTLAVIQKEQVIDSTVRIEVDGDGMVRRVQDMWGGRLPEGSIAKVS